MSASRTLTAAIATLTAAGLLTACGTSDGSEDVIRAKGQKDSDPGINIGPDQHRIRGKKVDAVAAQVPAAIRKRGTLRLGQSADSSPPLGFYATDDKTRIGADIDMAILIADTLGLKPVSQQVSWENLFVGLDSSKFDAVLSNVTVTEERKEKYDFATYRLDNIAFEAKKGSGWRVKGPADVAGKTIAVSSGTNQEKILVDWSEENVKAYRKPVEIKYFQNITDYYIALQSGRIDAYLGPSPSANYHVATASTSPRSSAHSPAEARASRGRSPPPRRRTAAWSRRTAPRSTTSSRTARTPRC